MINTVHNSPFYRLVQKTTLDFLMQSGQNWFAAKDLLSRIFFAIRGVTVSKRMSHEFGLPEIIKNRVEYLC